MLGRHAGFHFRHEHVEAFGHQAPGAAHAFEAFGAVDADFARAHGQEEVCVVSSRAIWQAGRLFSTPAWPLAETVAGPAS